MTAIIVFAGTLFLIAAFFALKGWEMRNERIIAPRFRSHLDQTALSAKRAALALEARTGELPQLLGTYARRASVLLVRRFARFSKGLADGAHELADFVSHKHNFERRDTSSRYLKEVLEHKNGNGRHP